MKKQQTSIRQSRTRGLIQAGGILYKSGLLDAFNIQLSEDLQDYESLHKAAQLLGFLSECLEENEFSDVKLTDWEKTGTRLLRYSL